MGDRGAVLQSSLLFSLIAGNYGAETGSRETASATTHSLETVALPYTVRKGAILRLFSTFPSLFGEIRDRECGFYGDGLRGPMILVLAGIDGDCSIRVSGQARHIALTIRQASAGLT